MQQHLTTTHTIPLISVPPPSQNVKRLHNNDNVNNAAYLYRCVYVPAKAQKGLVQVLLAILPFLAAVSVILYHVIHESEVGGKGEGKSTTTSSSSSLQFSSLFIIIPLIFFGVWLIPGFILLYQGYRLLAEYKVTLIIFNFDLELAIFRNDISYLVFCLKKLFI